MKKIVVLCVLAVIFSLSASATVNAEESVDSVCVVTVSKAEDGKMVFEAEGGFVDPADGHPEVYLFTNRKYIELSCKGGIEGYIKYTKEPNELKDLHIEYYKTTTRWEKLNSKCTLKNKIRISLFENGKEGHCYVGDTKFIIRKCAVLDSLDVTISYQYGLNDEPKDSTIKHRLPVGGEVTYDIEQSTRNFSIDVSRPVLGKVSEVIYDNKDTLAVGDNYFKGKSFQGTPADTVQNIIIKSYTIDEEYNEVPNTFSITFNRIQEPKGFLQSLKEHWKDVVTFVFIAILCVALGAIGFLLYKRKDSDPKSKTPKEAPKNPEKKEGPVSEEVEIIVPVDVAPKEDVVSQDVPAVNVDQEKMDMLQNFVIKVMEAVKLAPEKILEAEAGKVNEEIENVAKRISREREMYEMVDSKFSSEYQISQGKKKDVYERIIEGLQEDARCAVAICTALECEMSQVLTKIENLKSDSRKLDSLTTYIGKKLVFENMQTPIEIIDAAADRIANYNELAEENKKLKEERDLLNEQLVNIGRELEDIKQANTEAREIHKNNRELYLEKMTSVLGVLDASLEMISSNVLSSSSCAEIVKDIYTSTSGFKSFMTYFQNEDWSTFVKLSDIRDAMASRLHNAIAYERSWVNSIARFHAYLRVPQLEAHLAGSGVAKHDFETAFNAMNVLYTAFSDYKELIIPALFEDVYNPEAHDFDDQSVGNVISVVCSDYDSFRDNHSKLCDFNKIGYVKDDGTVVKPEVLF